MSKTQTIPTEETRATGPTLHEKIPDLGLPAAAINIGALHVYVNSNLRNAAGQIEVAARSLLTTSDCDDKTLWKLEEAYRVIANIMNRLESDEPTITAAERNKPNVGR